jgi:hypothetical protein
LSEGELSTILILFLILILKNILCFFKISIIFNPTKFNDSFCIHKDLPKV